MGRKIEIPINGVMYMGDTSPARDQVEMLSIATQNGLLPYLVKGVKDITVVSGIAGLNTMTFERLKELVIRKGEFKRASDDVPLSENLFQDQVHLFMLLLGRALMENVGPFWSLSDDEKTDQTADKK